MVDVPDRLEDHGPVFIYGVEGEQIEEENDAYNDLRFDIGKSFLRVNNQRSKNYSFSRHPQRCRGGNGRGNALLLYASDV